MTQLILDTAGDAVVLPECQEQQYTASLVPLSEDVEMVTGRLVRELRGNVWQITYQYGYFRDEMKKRVIAACRKGLGTPIRCSFLPPESDGELLSSIFWVMTFNEPKFFWSRYVNGTPVPMWGDFSLTLREVEPSD